MRAYPTDQDFSIKITHIPTGQEVKFVGWVTTFSDAFSSTWNETTVYGRMDPLPTFQNTSRKISIGFDVVAESNDQARINDNKLNRLIQFLYPVYDRGEGTSIPTNDKSIVAAAPLLKLRYANLAQNTGDQTGLVGYLDGFDYSPTIESGQFFSGRHDEMFYQQISVSLNFSVLHSHLTGWIKGSGNSFYFGADPNTGASAPYAHNFPHGGQEGGGKRNVGAGIDAMARLQSALSKKETDETRNGANSGVDKLGKAQVLGNDDALDLDDFPDTTPPSSDCKAWPDTCDDKTG
jgi:hypothetical protein